MAVGDARLLLPRAIGGERGRDVDVVGAGLGGGDDVALRLDGPRAQQDLPVGAAGGDREGRGVQEDLGWAVVGGGGVLAASGSVRMGMEMVWAREVQRGFREAEIEADETAETPDRGRDRRDQTRAGLRAGGLAERGVVEEVQLVVGGRGDEGPGRGNVDCAVVELRRRRRCCCCCSCAGGGLLGWWACRGYRGTRGR